MHWHCAVREGTAHFQEEFAKLKKFLTDTGGLRAEGQKQRFRKGERKNRVSRNMVQYAAYRVFSRTDYDQPWPIQQWIPDENDNKEIMRGFKLGPELDCTAFYNEFRANIRKAVTALENCSDIEEELEE